VRTIHCGSNKVDTVGAGAVDVVLDEAAGGGASDRWAHAPTDKVTATEPRARTTDGLNFTAPR
jgi:hypothetical protein